MNDALDTLFLALDQHPELDAGGKVAFVRGAPHPGLERFRGRLVCEQDFKPRATALEAEGWPVVKQIEGAFPLVLMLPDRQRELTLSDLARAWELVEEGGLLLCSVPNDWGAKRYEQHLREATGGDVAHVSKHHCRAFWTRKRGPGNEALLTQWKAGAELRRGFDGRFWTRPGLFSWDRIDPGSALLIEHLPAEIGGHVADLGGGWGFLSDFLLRERPGIDVLDVFEADRWAVEAARRNLGLIQVPVRVRTHWHDVAQGLTGGKYDWIVMNPPFHEGREADPLIGLRFIAAAAGALRTTGQLWLVANKQLPYENLMNELFGEVRQVVESNTFKVLAGAQPKVPAHHSKRRRDDRRSSGSGKGSFRKRGR